MKHLRMFCEGLLFTSVVLSGVGGILLVAFALLWLIVTYPFWAIPILSIVVVYIVGYILEKDRGLRDVDLST